MRFATCLIRSEESLAPLSRTVVARDLHVLDRAIAQKAASSPDKLAPKLALFDALALPCTSAVYSAVKENTPLDKVQRYICNRAAGVCKQKPPQLVSRSENANPEALPPALVVLVPIALDVSTASIPYPLRGTMRLP